MENKKQNLYGFLPDELAQIALNNHAAAYRGTQLFAGLSMGKPLKFINIDSKLKEALSQQYICELPQIVTVRESADKTRKYLLQLHDGNLIECVLMQRDYGNTLCISTQVGCRMGCVFCASGKDGLVRNLSAGEIVGQVIVVNAQSDISKSSKPALDKNADISSHRRNVTNIVLMGSGEPLDNYEQTVRFLQVISHKQGANISLRNISLSTCGLSPQIKRFAEEGLPVTLCLSMHSPFEDKRLQLMPIEKAYPLAKTIDALKYYFKKTGRRIIIEYSMIKDFNHSPKDALRLKQLLTGLNCHINLIKLSPVKNSPLQPCLPKQERDFLNHLKSLGLSATIRSQLGVDIEGACGQLRNNFVGDKSPKKDPN